MKKNCIFYAGIFALYICISLLNGKIFTNNLNLVYAQNQSVKYSYDSLGRVTSAIYPDGTKIVYEYDRNGNVLSCKKAGETETTETPAPPKDSGLNSLPDNQVIFVDMNTIFEDAKKYNAFKKKCPVIKSLKQTKSGGKYYLKIQIRKIKGLTDFAETGYQIKYATDSKFKKSKTVTVSKKKKSSLTDKKWKITKNKTYYVKVCAYAKTKGGKTIYSKYTKVKKFKIS